MAGNAAAAGPMSPGEPAGRQRSRIRAIASSSPGRFGWTMAWWSSRPLPPSRSTSSRVPAISEFVRMFRSPSPGAEVSTATAVSLSRYTQRR